MCTHLGGFTYEAPMATLLQPPLAWCQNIFTAYFPLASALRSESKQIKQSVRGRRLPCASPSLMVAQQRCLHGDSRHTGSVQSLTVQHLCSHTYRRWLKLQPHSAAPYRYSRESWMLVDKASGQFKIMFKLNYLKNNLNKIWFVKCMRCKKKKNKKKEKNK